MALESFKTPFVQRALGEGHTFLCAIGMDDADVCTCSGTCNCEELPCVC